MVDHDTREPIDTTLAFQRAADAAQLRLRTAADALKLARHQLTIVVEGGAEHDVRVCAEAARDELDNAEQAVAEALRVTVDASGMVEIRERVAASQADTMRRFHQFIGRARQ